MTNDDQLPAVLASALMLLLVMSACIIHYLPADLAIFLVSWLMLSVSLGVTFGHCVLSEPLSDD